jgi:hypothetical protein
MPLRGCLRGNRRLDSRFSPEGRREGEGVTHRAERREEEEEHLALAEAISDFLKASDSKVRRTVSTSASRAGQALLESRVLGSEEREDWMFQKVR